MKQNHFAHLLRLITVALMLVGIAIQRDGRMMGNDLTKKAEVTTANTVQPTITTRDDGTVVINTTQIAKDVTGYAGPTPLTITMKDGVVTKVEAGANNESPEFFGEAFDFLKKKWMGKKVDEIMAMKPDGVSGATMSSNALNATMRKAMAQVEKSSDGSQAQPPSPWSASKLAVLAVVALGCILPLFGQFKKYRTLWLVVNVLVLGLWGGTFLSYALFVGWMSNGTHLITSLAAVLMLVAAFIYPFFGKKSYYCTWMCPLGSLQELAGKMNKHHKWHLSTQTAKRLTRFNELLWAALMLLMLTGVWFAWVDYEPFTASLFTTASPVVIGVTLVFVVLSVFVPHPYCRFVCPTGCLFRVAQQA